MTAQHTPTPWTVDDIRADFGETILPHDIYNVAGGEYIDLVATVQESADAAYIVRAVNNHERLVEAAALALAESERADAHFGHVSPATTALRAALEAAREGGPE